MHRYIITFIDFGFSAFHVQGLGMIFFLFSIDLLKMHLSETF